MKSNKGITMIVLVITIIILLVIVGISIGTGGNVIKQTQLENLKTNMLLIKVKGKEYVENANFNLGTKFSEASEEEKASRIEKAKSELKGEEIQEISMPGQNINISEDNAQNIYYYKLTTQDLTNMGLTNLKSDDKDGWYIIKYDVANEQVEIYNTKGFKVENKTYYALNEIEDLEL